jgi:hypothetical protein
MTACSFSASTAHISDVKVGTSRDMTTQAQFDKSFDRKNDSDVSVSYTPPTAGWPAGTYKIDAVLTEDGDKRDEKSAEFTFQ